MRRRFATIQELAKAVDKHETTVRRKLVRSAATFIWDNGPGGSEKKYLVSFLPKEYRIALAAIDAVPVSDDPVSFEERVGTKAAQAILAKSGEQAERDQIAKEDGLAAFEKLPVKRRAEAQARFALMQACDGFVKAASYDIKKYARRSKIGDKAFVEAYNNGLVPVDHAVLDLVGSRTSYSTLKRICDAYYKWGLAGLAFGYHNPKKGSTELSQVQQDAVLAAMALNPQTSSKNIRRLLEGKFGADVPSTGVITRFRNRWEKENQDLWLYYTNPDAWKNKKMFAFGSASDQVERLNQLWEADSTPADLMLTDGRYSLIGMVDVYSRRLRYFVSKTSKADSVVALIRHCLIDWGVPEAIKTDNGKDYISKHVVRVIDGLGINQILCTPFQGQEKPHIERSFKSFLHGLVEMMPNYIGHDIPERKAIEARRSFADRVMNKGSEAVEVSMSSHELQKFCDEWINFVYLHDAHRGLDGRKPIDMIRGWKQPIRRINNMRALDMLLMAAPKDGGGRVIKKKGIRVDGREYQSPEFASHVGDQVYVLLDPVDLGTVYVYLENSNGERTFLCPAIDPEWVGIDRAAFAVSARQHQDKIMRKGRAELRRISKAQAIDTAYNEYIAFRKGSVENIVEFPNLGIDYDTPALQEAARAADASTEETKKQELGFGTENERIFVTEDDFNAAGIDAEAAAPLKKSDTTVLIRSESEQYQLLSSQIRETGRPLTEKEHTWLSYFYEKTAIGELYRKAEGDLIKRAGVEGQAKVRNI